MEETPRTELSSHLTAFYKVVFPLLWLSGFGGATLLMWATPKPDARATAVPFTIATIIGAFVFAKLLVPLKRVVAGDDGLRIGNYLRNIDVPYAEIARVEQNKWINTNHVTIWLNADSLFGQKIIFMPYTRFTFTPWRDHPAVTWLRQRVAASKGVA